MHIYSYLLLQLLLQLLLAVNTNGTFPSFDNAESAEVCHYEPKDSSALLREIHDEEVLDVYANEWLVGILGGSTVADELAEKLGFVNNGLEGDGENVYMFVLEDEATPQFGPYDMKTQLLLMEENVVFAKQKPLEIVCSKQSRNREKRLVVEDIEYVYLSSDVLLVRWNQTDKHPLVLRYELVHTVISVNSGNVNHSEASYEIHRDNTSFILHGINQSNFNIYTFKVITHGYTYSYRASYNPGLPSDVPMPSNVEIETVNSTSIKISWEPVPYPSYVIIHHYHSLEIIYVGNSSFFKMNDQHHLFYYRIIVMHVSGNHYGADVYFHWLEAVRLVDGDGRCEGRVEVYHDGEWGTVCDDYWSSNDADVVCSQLYCGDGVEAVRRAEFGRGTGPIWMDDVWCTKEDTHLEGCDFAGWGVHNCDHSEDAGVRCFIDENLCDELFDPPNGGVTFSGVYEGDAAKYHCDDGYQLSEDVIRRCINGEWTGEEPICTPIGNDCEVLQNPANGQVTVTDSTATYTCDSGYEVVGDDTQTCEDGVWNGQEPTCIEILCEDLQNPANGEVSMTGLSSGSIATYTCDDGYEVIGDERRICENGEWSGQEPNCSKICDELLPPENGEVIVIDGVNAFYSCDDGYQLDGEDARECVDGEWTGEDPTCINTEVTCETLQDPANGQVTMSGQTIGSTASYTCENGYELIGNEIRTCVDGVWTGEEPICIEILCEDLQNPANGEVSMTGLSSGSIATYTCDEGYELTGDEMRRCVDGEWTGQEPNCSKTCDDLLPPNNGEVIVIDGAICVIYSCDDGYQLVGDDTRKCIDGEWTGEEPVCIRGCNELLNPPNGEVTYTNITEGSIATYDCDDGYEFIGDKTRICEDGEWTGEAPTCKKLCDELPAPSNGYVYVINNVIAVYHCDDGYILSEDLVRRCVDGEWTGEEPTCIPVCDELSAPPNGEVTLTGITEGSEARYDCDEGYELNGDDVRTCEDGVWTGEEPTCIPLCDELPDPLNGGVTMTGLTEGSEATYHCDRGYQLSEDVPRICKDGEWTGQEPKCIPLCDPLSPPTNGGVTWNGLTEGSIATYTCDEGYELTGDERRCVDGEWTGQEPNCSKRCDELLPPDNGEVIVIDGVNAFYSCDEGYQLDGEDARKCVDGEWIGQAPTCIPVCGELSAPPNGEVTWNDIIEGSVAKYHCDDGYQLVGDQSRECQDGEWTGQQPICLRIVIGPPHVHLSKESATHLKVSWNHSCIGPPMTMYKVTHMYVSTGSSYSMNQRTITDISPSTTSIVVEDVSFPPGSTHIVVITAVSEDASATSEIVYLQTASCSEMPLPLEINAGSSPDSAILSWQKPIKEPSHFIVIYFTLDVQMSSSPVAGQAASYEMTNLQSGVCVIVILYYDSTLLEYNACYYRPVLFTRAANELACQDCAPAITKITEMSSSNLSLTWKSCGGPPSTNYIITMLPVSTGASVSTRNPVHHTLPPTATSTMFNGLDLKAGNSFIFVVTDVSGDVMTSSKPKEYKIPPLYPVPPPPSDVSAVQVSPTSVELSWAPPNTTATIFLHHICYVPIVQNGIKTLHSVPVPTNEFTLTQLTSGLSYIVVVIASGADSSCPSEALVIKLDPDFPLCHDPASLLPVITNLTPIQNEFHMSWNHPCDGPPTTNYIITQLFISTGSQFTNTPPVYTELPSSANSTVITDAQVNISDVYIFVVTAVSGNTSKSSIPEKFKLSDPSNGPPPTDVIVTQLTSTSARVDWEPPQGDAPLIYNICFVPTLPSGQIKQLNGVPGTVNTHVLTGLDSHTTYMVLVVASSGTTSCPSDPVNFTLE